MPGESRTEQSIKQPDAHSVQNDDVRRDENQGKGERTHAPASPDAEQAEESCTA